MKSHFCTAAVTQYDVYEIQPLLRAMERCLKKAVMWSAVHFKETSVVAGRRMNEQWS